AMLLGFFFASRRRHTRFSRDWSSDVCSSDLFYVQYASARCHSVFRQAREQFPGVEFSREDLKKYAHLLVDEGELALIRKLVEYPDRKSGRVGKESRSRSWRGTETNRTGAATA